MSQSLQFYYLKLDFVAEQRERSEVILAKQLCLYCTKLLILETKRKEEEKKSAEPIRGHHTFHGASLPGLPPAMFNAAPVLAPYALPLPAMLTYCYPQPVHLNGLLTCHYSLGPEPRTFHRANLGDRVQLLASDRACGCPHTVPTSKEMRIRRT